MTAIINSKGDIQIIPEGLSAESCPNCNRPVGSPEAPVVDNPPLYVLSFAGGPNKYLVCSRCLTIPLPLSRRENEVVFADFKGQPLARSIYEWNTWVRLVRPGLPSSK